MPGITNKHQAFEVPFQVFFREGTYRAGRYGRNQTDKFWKSKYHLRNPTRKFFKRKIT